MKHRILLLVLSLFSLNSYGAVGQTYSQPSATPVPTTSHAPELELSFDIPSVTGTFAQSFNSGLGGSAVFYFPQLLDPSLHNFISVGFQTFAVKTDTSISFRVVPVLLGLEVRGRVYSDLKSTLALAAGGSFGFLNIPNATNLKVGGYFTAQVKPGLEWDMSNDFALVGRMPLTFIMASTYMSYIAGELGVRMRF